MWLLNAISRAANASWRAAQSIWEAFREPFTLFHFNRLVATQPIDTTHIEALGDDDLKEFVQAEWERAKHLDDKLQKLTAALSVAVTVGGLAGSTMLQNISSLAWRGAAAVLFLVAAFLLVSGVVLGFNGLRPKPRYGYGAAFLGIIAAGGDDARKELIEAACGFQRDNLIRSNETVAATSAIRNGVVIFALGVTIGLIAAIGNKAPVGMPPQSVTIFREPQQPFCVPLGRRHHFRPLDSQSIRQTNHVTPAMTV